MLGYSMQKIQTLYLSQKNEFGQMTTQVVIKG